MSPDAFVSEIPTLAWPEADASAAPAAKGTVGHGRALLPLVAQDALTGQVLMLGWACREALEATCRDRYVTFFSRSKGRLWRKGEESGNLLELVSLHVDCDRDAVLALANPRGPACHRLTPTCFDALQDEGAGVGGGVRPVEPVAARLGLLARTVRERARDADAGSYTGKLLAAGTDRILRKVGEEATEFVIAAMAHAHAPSESARAELAGEAADVIFHVLVALEDAGLGLEDVTDVLAAREGKRRPGATLASKI